MTDDEKDKLRLVVQEWLAFLVQASAHAELLAHQFADVGEEQGSAGAAQLAGLLLGTAQAHYKFAAGRDDSDEIDDLRRQLLRPEAN